MKILRAWSLVLVVASCGGEPPEDVTAEATPIDPGAESALTRPPPDLGWPTTTPDGPVITPRSNINASAATGAQTDADIAVDPTDTPYFNHLVAAADDAVTHTLNIYESWNGATTWVTHKAPSPTGAFGGATRHGAVAYDLAGDAFVSAIAYDAAGAHGRVAVSRRPVGAGSFSRFAVVNAADVDRQRIAVDRISSSPYQGRVYVAWSDGQAVLVSASGDGGATFGAAVRVSDDGAATSPYPAVAADGALYVAWLDPGRGQLRIDRSTDGGATFGVDHVVHALATTGATIASPAAPGGVRLAPFCDVDRSTGPRRGTVFCAYTDRAGANGLDVFLRRSVDGGATWSPPRRMSDDPTGSGADQLLPRVQIDDGSGKVSVAWYDTRDDAAHAKTHVYFTRANDGVSFVPSVRVTKAQSNEARAGAAPEGYGEALGMEAWKGRIRVLWTDSRAADEETYSCIIDFAHFSFYFAGSDTLTMPRGGTAQLGIRIDAVGPFVAPVQLSLLGMPPGTSGTLSVNPVSPGGTATLTVSAGSAPAGRYPISLKGKGGGEETSRPITLVVQ